MLMGYQWDTSVNRTPVDSGDTMGYQWIAVLMGYQWDTSVNRTPVLIAVIPWDTSG